MNAAISSKSPFHCDSVFVCHIGLNPERTGWIFDEHSTPLISGCTLDQWVLTTESKVFCAALGLSFSAKFQSEF